MKTSTIVKLAALGVAALVIALVAAVKSIDVNSYRGLMAHLAEQATGRKLDIRGPMDLKLGLTPRLVAEDITFANADWGSQPAMVTAKRLEAEIGLFPLLSKQVHVYRLVLVEPTVLLETDAKGRRNWDFQAAGPVSEPHPAGAPVVPRVQEVTVQKGRLLITDARSGSSHELALTSFSAQADTLARPINLTAKGSWDNRPFDLGGQVGPLADLVANGKPWAVRLKVDSGTVLAAVDGAIDDVVDGKGYNLKIRLEAGELADALTLLDQQIRPMGPVKATAVVSDAKGPIALTDIDAAVGRKEMLLLSAKGQIKDLLALRGVELSATAETENLAKLSELAGNPLPQTAAIKLAGRVQSDAGTVWKVSDLKGVVGKSDLAGTLELGLGGSRPAVGGSLASTLVDLTDFGAAPAKAEPTKTEVAKAAAEPPAPLPPPSSRVLPDSDLGLDGLTAVDLALGWKIDKLVYREAQAQALDAAVTLKGGRLDARLAQAELAGGRLRGELRVDAAAGPAPAVAAKLTAGKVDLGGLLTQVKVTDAVQGAPADLSLTLRGEGRTVRQIMAGLDGDATLVLGQGRLGGAYADLLALDVLRELMPFTESARDTRMECFVGRFTVKDGLAESQALLFDTDQMTMGGEGRVNFGNEGLDFTLVPKPKNPSLLNLATAMDVGGTLSRPTVLPNKAALAKGVVGAVGGLALGPLGLLVPLVTTGSGDANPCVTAIAQVRKGGKVKPRAGGVEGLLDGLFGN